MTLNTMRIDLAEPLIRFRRVAITAFGVTVVPEEYVNMIGWSGFSSGKHCLTTERPLSPLLAVTGGL